MAMASVIQTVENFVREEMKGNDGSHDWFHVDRVRRLALQIANEEKIENLKLIEVAALLHDVRDRKYQNKETKESLAEVITNLLKPLEFNEDFIEKVIKIVSNCSYSKELCGGIEMFPELACVIDADRLDAIGAIGVARTFCFGGRKNRALWNIPSQNVSKDFQLKIEEKVDGEDYKKRESTTLEHFGEKLLKLKGLMKTKTGLKMAEKRHEFMEEFVSQFVNEWGCHHQQERKSRSPFRERKIDETKRKRSRSRDY